MVGGTTSTVLHPLRTLAGVGGSDNGSADDGAGGSTTTTNADNAAAATKKTRRTTTTAATATTRPSARTTTTGVAGGSTTTRVAAAPPPTSPIGNCRAADLDYTTRTNKPSYRPNEQVGIELVVRNKADRPCYAPGPCGTGPWVSIEDTAGTVIWKNSPKALACERPQPTPPLLNPNDAHNYGTVASWNQLVCEGDACQGPHAPAGTYSAQAHRGDVNAGSVVFALRG